MRQAHWSGLDISAALDDATVAALQEAQNFRLPLPELLERRMSNPRAEAEGGDLITDDFAPVNLYDVIGRDRPRPTSDCPR